MKRPLKSLVVLLLLLSSFSPALAVTTTPTILPYEGVLKDASAVPVITAQDFRFSIWNDSDYDAPADFDGSGNIPGGAPGFSGYSEVQTVTPDSSGFFQINIGSFNPIPDFNTTTYLYLQVEIKPNGSPDTSYEILDIDGTVNATDRQAFGTVPYSSNSDFLDNAELGTSAGDIAVLGLGGVFSESFIPGGTNQNDFTLDSDNSGGDITLQFGTTLNETLTWDNTNSEFDLSDDLNVSGNVIVSGTTNTSGITSTGTVNFSGSTTFRIREVANEATATCTNVGELVLDSTENRIYVCTAIGAPGTWVAAAPDQDLDSVYTTDTDKTLAVNNASGLTFNSSTAGNILFNLQNTGDLVVQDNGTNFALFSDTGLFELSGLENTERLRLSDTTNADSVGLYVGTGTPDAVISAQSGSAYFDELGALYINNSVGSGTTWNRVSLDKAQTVTVAKSGAEFTSVKAAVDSITDASTTKRYVVHVYPGTYAEDPMTLPDFVSVVGEGTFTNVIITANVTTSNLIIGGAQSIIRNIQLQGASGAGGVCLRTSKVTYVQDIEVNDCETGLLGTSSTGSLVVNNLVVRAGVFMDLMRLEAGATGNLNALRVTSSSPISKVFHVTGTGTRAQLNNAVIRLSSVTDAVYVNDGALGTILNSNFQDMVNGIHVGPVGASIVRGSGGIIENTSGYTFYVESGAAQVFYDAVNTQKERFNVHPGALFSLTFNNSTSGEAGFNVFGRASVGTPERPDDTFVGSGDPFTNGMLVYTFDGLTYTNVSSAAANPVGTPFGFPGVTAGNAVYLSSDRRDPSLNYLRFGGLQYLTASTVPDMGTGEIVHEYWNGSAWTEFDSFCYNNDFYYRYDDHCFLRPDSEEQNNFSADIMDDWAVNDPPSTGTNRYWIRLRIATAIATAPVFEQFKIQPHSMKVSANGSVVLMGESRGVEQIVHGSEEIFHTISTNSPDNASYEVGVGTTVVVDEPNALFRGSGINLDELSGSFAIPRGLDTATPLEVKIYWRKTTNAAGTVQWKIDYVHNNPRNVLVTDGSNIATAPRPLGNDHVHGTITIETAPTDSASSGEAILSEFSPGLSVSSHYEGDLVYIRLYRDAADPDDTYTGDAIMTGFEINGLFWDLSPKPE